jgi:hypothetical protein
LGSISRLSALDIRLSRLLELSKLSSIRLMAWKQPRAEKSLGAGDIRLGLRLVTQTTVAAGEQ